MDVKNNAPDPCNLASTELSERLFPCALLCAGSQVLPLSALASRSDAQEIKKGLLGRKALTLLYPACR